LWAIAAETWVNIPKAFEWTDLEFNPANWTKEDIATALMILATIWAWHAISKVKFTKSSDGSIKVDVSKEINNLIATKNSKNIKTYLETLKQYNFIELPTKWFEVEIKVWKKTYKISKSDGKYYIEQWGNVVEYEKVSKFIEALKENPELVLKWKQKLFIDRLSNQLAGIKGREKIWEFEKWKEFKIWEDEYALLKDPDNWEFCVIKKEIKKGQNTYKLTKKVKLEDFLKNHSKEIQRVTKNIVDNMDEIIKWLEKKKVKNVLDDDTINKISKKFNIPKSKLSKMVFGDFFENFKEAFNIKKNWKEWDYVWILKPLFFPILGKTWTWIWWHVLKNWLMLFALNILTYSYNSYIESRDEGIMDILGWGWGYTWDQIVWLYVILEKMWKWQKITNEEIKNVAEYMLVTHLWWLWAIGWVAWIEYMKNKDDDKTAGGVWN
jgi:hypothetical protein